MDNNQNKFVLPLPGVIRIEPSSVCNFKCRHCTNGRGLNKSLGIMSRDTFDKVYDRIKDHHFRVSVLYHGGEPLLNTDLFYFLDQMSKISDFIKMDCNGSLLTDENIVKIIASPLNHLVISLDGLSAEENDKIRVGSNFEKISSQLIKLAELKKEKKSQLKITISNVQIPMKATDTKKIEPPPYLLQRFAGQLADINIQTHYAIIWPDYPFRTNQEKNSQPKRNRCDNIESTITIRWNGDVVPCCYDITSKLVMGNILDNSLEEIWNNKKYLALRELIYNFKPPMFCDNCGNLYDQAHLFREEIPNE